MADDRPMNQRGEHVAAGLRVSTLSLLWTLVAGAASVVLGITTNSLVLLAFGGFSVLDAAGSLALILHFRHVQRHDTFSPRRERVALTLIVSGLAVMGAATAVDSVIRLSTHAGESSNVAGVALAATSTVVLARLSSVKRRVARRVGSHALYADGWLSLAGSALAAVTLAGTGLNEAFHWWWLDPTASLVIAAGAVAVSVALTREGRRVESDDAI